MEEESQFGELSVYSNYGSQESFTNMAPQNVEKSKKKSVPKVDRGSLESEHSGVDRRSTFKPN